ncbi:MAG TPA: alanine dehydrogenase [Acidimicrobiia bacterium]|nr:alanine dehydrogenase [Acidimicrobiia bacterium]
MTTRVGIPKEIKMDESRVALTPEGVKELTSHGAEVFVEHNAGAGIHLSDDAYAGQGATICDAQTAWGCDLVVKVKEPQKSEFTYFRKDLTLFTYLHLAAYPHVADALCDAGVTGIAYETVLVDGGLPLLAPMSEIAGKLSIQVAMRFLEKPQGGRGVLLSGASGVAPAHVSVLGAGHVGLNAALLASAMGAHVDLIDINTEKLRTIDEQHPGKFNTLASSPSTILESISKADAVIGGVLVPGGRAPIVVTTDMVSQMKPGSIVVDTAIDQGGCIETSHETSHAEPIYMVGDVIHYAVGNMPGAVPYTSTYALTNATLSYIVALATQPLDDAVDMVEGLREGINTRDGEIVNEFVKKAVFTQ